MPLPNLFVFYSVFLRIATIFAAIMEFTSNILTSSNQQKSFYLMLIICHTRIKVNIIVTILYHFIHLVSISVTTILRYPPLFHFAILHRRGAPVLETKACRDSSTPYPCSIRTDILAIYPRSLSLHYDDAHIKAASSTYPKRVSGLHGVV